MGDLTMAGLWLAAAVAAAVGAARAGTPVLKSWRYAWQSQPRSPRRCTPPDGCGTSRRRRRPTRQGVPVSEIEGYCDGQHETRDYQGRAECIGGQINGYLWLLQHQAAARAGR